MPATGWLGALAAGTLVAGVPLLPVVPATPNEAGG